MDLAKIKIELSSKINFCKEGKIKKLITKKTELNHPNNLIAKYQENQQKSCN